jgi:glycyl-tRNA synthetase beta chain
MQTEVFLSVAALSLSNPLDIDARVAAVHKFSLLPEAAALAAANKRVSNILAKQLPEGNSAPLDPSLLQDTAEIQLADQLLALEEQITPLLSQRDYNAVLEKLAGLRETVDQFFEDVMVMADDMALRQNRLALLAKLQQLFMHVADISLLAPAK